MNEFPFGDSNRPRHPRTFTPEQERFFVLADRGAIGYSMDAIEELPEYQACKRLFREYADKGLSFWTDEGHSFVANIARSYVNGLDYRTHRSSVYGREDAARALVALAKALGFRAHVEHVYPGETGYVFVLDVPR